MEEGGNLQRELDAPVIFFDGVCGICNRFVDYVLTKDQKHVFRFSPLQGQYAKRLLGDLAERNDTIVLFQDGRVYTRSEAILKILPRLGLFEYQLAEVAKKIPRSVRDWIYRRVSNHRYRCFGKRDQCRLPSPEERSYFIEEE